MYLYMFGSTWRTHCLFSQFLSIFVGVVFLLFFNVSILDKTRSEHVQHNCLTKSCTMCYFLSASTYFQAVICPSPIEFIRSALLFFFYYLYFYFYFVILVRLMILLALTFMSTFFRFMEKYRILLTFFFWFSWRLIFLFSYGIRSMYFVNAAPKFAIWRRKTNSKKKINNFISFPLNGTRLFFLQFFLVLVLFLISVRSLKLIDRFYSLHSCKWNKFCGLLNEKKYSFRKFKCKLIFGNA